MQSQKIIIHNKYIYERAACTCTAELVSDANFAQPRTAIEGERKKKQWEFDREAVETEIEQKQGATVALIFILRTLSFVLSTSQILLPWRWPTRSQRWKLLSGEKIVLLLGYMSWVRAFHRFHCFFFLRKSSNNR